MVKPIVIKGKDESYTLEFNRDSVRFAETRGFKYEDVSDFPMTKIPELFFYAFRMHHPKITRIQADNIFDEIGGLPEGAIERLVELYIAPFESLTVPEGAEPKNSKWTVEM